MGILKKINDFFGFGFGVIERWVFVYVFSTGIGGIGAGIIWASLYYANGKFVLNTITTIGVILLVIATFLANIAHSILKKKVSKK